MQMVKVHHRAKFRRNRSIHCRDIVIFYFLLSWISYARAWTTHEGRLVVFIAVQNLVGIDALR